LVSPTGCKAVSYGRSEKTKRRKTGKAGGNANLWERPKKRKNGARGGECPPWTVDSDRMVL